MDPAATGKPKTKIKGNKKTDKEKDVKGKVTKGKGKDVVLNYAKFEGQGLNYKCKLFGCAEVPGPRGDKSSVEAIHKLKQQAKQLKKGANEHKLKIIFRITLRGVQVINEKTQAVEHEHVIHKISFISHDPEDRHVFGYIYNPPRAAATEARKYFLFAIKAEKYADAITSQLYELFQVVYKIQENRKARSKADSTGNLKPPEKVSPPLEPLQDKILFEMSSKLGGDQHHPVDKHLYAEPTYVKNSPPASQTPHYAIPSDRKAISSTESKDNEYEVPRVNNGVVDVKNETLAPGSASPSFPRDPFFERGMNDSGTFFSGQPSDHAFRSATNEDSGFEADFDSALSSLSTEAKAEQFQDDFSPCENGFTSSANTNHPEGNVVLWSSSDPPQFNALNSSVECSTSTGPDRETENSERENKAANIGAVSSSAPLSISNDVTQSEPERRALGETKIMSDEGQPENYSRSDPVDSKLPDLKGEKLRDEKQSSSTAVSSLSGDINETEMSQTNRDVMSDRLESGSAFEVNFQNEDNESIKPQRSERDELSSFDSISAAFGDDDPFLSDNPTEPDKASYTTFAADDPFSPAGGANTETMTDPFAGNDDIFSGGFDDTAAKNSEDTFGEKNTVFNSDLNPNDRSTETRNGDVFVCSNCTTTDPKNDGAVSEQANKKPEIAFEKNEGDVDVFEAMFEANIEVDDAEDAINDDSDKNETLTNATGDHAKDVNDREQANIAREEPGNAGDETTVESGHRKYEDMANDAPVLLSEEDSGSIENVVVQEVEPQSEAQEQQDDTNTFDMTTGDYYVTLRTAAEPANNRPLSPSESSPPPLPPRPTLPVHTEVPNSSVIPKEPPALPPRPSDQSLSSVNATRKPPELPPRVDLEEKNYKIDPFCDDIECRNHDSEPNKTSSSLFQTNFDSFDFNTENNVGATGNSQHSTTTEFDVGDPFKDPFVESDPFQTPISADPFASSPSFSCDQKKGSAEFDPFSGDDPFAPTSDSQKSFQSHLSFGETKDNNSNDQFADFSGFSPTFN